MNTITEDLPSNSDKVFHVIAYFILTLLWFFAFTFKFKYSNKKAMQYASGLAIVYGVIIEVLQTSLTQLRQGDFNDVIANTIGVLLAILFILNLKKHVKS